MNDTIRTGACAALLAALGLSPLACGGDDVAQNGGDKLDGTSIGTKASMAFVAPLGAAAIIDSENQAWLDAIWTQVTASPMESHSADTAKLLSMIVMSGNWWNP